ncbi:MAG: cbb3-type cytochrome oxidase assembly protein CcoS [Candidatus Methanoperedens sp.]|nr:cbb3-type cytochrome oxidase assembly protein CcoS [Candidatus Methanoperedens sp.]
MTDGIMPGDPSMSTDYLIILIASVVILVIFPILLYWGWRKGQFKDIEEAKYRMIEMEDEYAD